MAESEQSKSLGDNQVERDPDFQALLQQFRDAVKDGDIKQREAWKDRQGKMHYVDYVEWHTVADVLDEITPDWENAIEQVIVIGNTVAVVESITITINGKSVRRMGIGTGAAETEMGIKKASHDALKRAAVKWGIARRLYEKETKQIEREGSQQGRSKPEQVVATNEQNAASPPQKNLIGYKCKMIGIDADAECMAEMGCEVDVLSKAAASWFIDHLKQIETGEKEATSKQLGEASPAPAVENPTGTLFPDRVVEGHEGPPPGPRPQCYCDPPNPCRWVAGPLPNKTPHTPAGKGDYAMWICAKDKNDPTHCTIQLDRNGKSVKKSGGKIKK